jgi:hypothetical protein
MPYVPLNPLNYSTGWGQPTGSSRPFVPVDAGYWILPSAGSYFDAANNRMWVAWWQRYDSHFHDLVQRVTYDLNDPGPATVSHFWSSTQAPLPGAPAGRPPSKDPSHADYRFTLRTETGSAAPLNYTAVRIAKVLKNHASPQVIVSSSGGRVSLLHGDTGMLIAESDDFGFGGMALAVADIYDNGNDGLSEILFAPLYGPIEHTGGSVRSYLHVLTSNAAGTG